MLMPNEYYLEEGKDAPEGTVVKKCSICGRAFALPADVAEKVGEIQVCDADECRETYEKQAAAEAAALMKPNNETAETIKTALGN